jgi:hypothetical protein
MVSPENPQWNFVIVLKQRSTSSEMRCIVR